MFPTTSAAVSQASIASSSASKMSFQRITSTGSTWFSKRPAIASRRRLSARLRAPSHGRGGARRCSRAALERLGKVLDSLDEDPALLERLLHRTVDLVEREEVGRVLDEVDDVVDRLRELVDVLPVEGVTYCVFRSSMIWRVRSSPLFSSSLTCAWRTSRSGNARKRASTRRAASSAFSPAALNRS